MAKNSKIKSTPTSTFAGFYFFLDFLEKQGIIDLIDKELGVRGKKNSHKYSDILKNYLSIFIACRPPILVYESKHCFYVDHGRVKNIYDGCFVFMNHVNCVQHSYYQLFTSIH